MNKNQNERTQREKNSNAQIIRNEIKQLLCVQLDDLIKR